MFVIVNRNFTYSYFYFWYYPSDLSGL